MKHNFSADFLQVTPPDSCFGEAWESLCYDLLVAELQDKSLLRIGPPDKGVDILSQRAGEAYQCKSDERGALGSIAHRDSVASLKTALMNRGSLNWNSYSFCTNARYTASALTAIKDCAESSGLGKNCVDFKGPEYWDALCTKHFPLVSGRFYYRVTATEKQVIDALRAAGYYDKYVQEFAEKIRETKISLIIKNNRTPLEIEIPFSPELTVENCLDVTQELLGISLDWTNFLDVSTSAGPQISLTIDRTAQGFKQKIKDLPLKPGENLEMWIKTVWRDETQKQGVSHEDRMNVFLALGDAKMWVTFDRKQLTYEDRKKLTLDRAEEMFQTMIWGGVARIKSEQAEA